MFTEHISAVVSG